LNFEQKRLKKTLLLASEGTVKAQDSKGGGNGHGEYKIEDNVSDDEVGQ